MANRKTWPQILFGAALLVAGAVLAAEDAPPPPPPPPPQAPAAASATPPAATVPVQERLLALNRDAGVILGTIRGRLIPAMTAANPGALPTASGSLAETYLALAAVEAEKARDYLGMVPPQLEAAAASLQAAREVLAASEPKTPATGVRNENLIEHAYFARNDGSPQPYFVYVPKSCPADKPAPLVVFLHGYVPTTARTDPYLVPSFVTDLAEKHGTILVIPHGRTNTDFQYAGEVDVLRVKAEMEKFYRIDPDRIYLLGVSMGAAGVWQIAEHYPDVWAGAAPINGQADWFRFWNEKFEYPPRAALPKHIEYLVALNNPLDLVQNLSCLYSYSQHATLCFVGVYHTQAMVARLKELGAPYETFEDPSELGHFIYWRPECWARAWEHLVKQTRQHDPPKIRYATYSLRFPGAYWATIRGFEKWGSLAVVEASRTENGVLEVNTQNVAELELGPPKGWAATDGTFKVRWNGQELAPAPLDAAGHLRLARPAAAAAERQALRKSQALCGPAADVFNFPFIVVRGTTGTAAETDALSQLATQFADDWYRYAEGRVAILRDVEVTDAIMQAKGLVLVGLPETNAVVQRLAGKLPFGLSREAIVFPDGKRFPAAGNGLLLTYPNPLAPQRYILILNGLHWGEGSSQNHKFDRIPDFTIFSGDSLSGIGSNRFLAAGLFDANWHYDPALTDFAPAAPPKPQTRDLGP